MPLVVIGVLLLLGWWLDIGPLGRTPWWGLCLPFLGAVLWWEFADSTGWTQRRAIDRMEKRKVDRREKAMDALGLSRRRERQVTRAQVDRARSVSADPTQVDHPPEPVRRDPKL